MSMGEFSTVRESHENTTHIAEVTQTIPAVHSGVRYEIADPSSTRTLCGRGMLHGEVLCKAPDKATCHVCQTIYGHYYGGDQE